MFKGEVLSQERFKQEVLLSAYRARRRWTEGRTVQWVEDTIGFQNREIGEFFLSLRSCTDMADRVYEKGLAGGNRKEGLYHVLHDLTEKLAELCRHLEEDLAERLVTRFALGNSELYHYLGQIHLTLDLWPEHHIDEFLSGAQVLLEGWTDESDRSIFWTGLAEYWSDKVWGEMAHQLIPQPLLAALVEQSGPGQKMAAYVGIDSGRQKAELRHGLAQRWDGALTAWEQLLKKETTHRTAQVLYSVHDQSIDQGLAARMELLEAKLDEDLALQRREA